MVFDTFVNPNKNYPQIFSRNSKPFGLTFPQWTSKWWQWVLSIPIESNPGNDEDGQNSTLGQGGPVWFLVGTFENIQHANRKCTIPSGKALLVPIINSEKSFLEFPELKTETELKNRAKNAIDRVKKLSISIDSKKISNLANYRVRSDPFEVNFPEHNVFGVEPGFTRAVSDGYWIMLKPLPPGKHTLHFGGEAYCQKEMLEFKTDVTYHLTFE